MSAHKALLDKIMIARMTGGDDGAERALFEHLQVVRSDTQQEVYRTYFNGDYEDERQEDGLFVTPSEEYCEPSISVEIVGLSGADEIAQSVEITKQKTQHFQSTALEMSVVEDGFCISFRAYSNLVSIWESEWEMWVDDVSIVSNVELSIDEDEYLRSFEAEAKRIVSQHLERCGLQATISVDDCSDEGHYGGCSCRITVQPNWRPDLMTRLAAFTLAIRNDLGDTLISVGLECCREATAAEIEYNESDDE